MATKEGHGWSGPHGGRSEKDASGQKGVSQEQVGSGKENDLRAQHLSTLT